MDSLIVVVYSDIWGNNITTILTGDKQEIKLNHDEFSCITSEYKYSDYPKDPKYGN